jgi:hypothetical protein
MKIATGTRIKHYEILSALSLFEGDANLASLRNEARFILFMATRLKQQWQHYDATL